MMTMPKLIVVIASTRPGRVGLPVGQWFFEKATKHAGFEVELVDLAELNLPFLDEPAHPRFQRYEHQHTKDWSARVAGADAFAFVTPEYNFSYPAALKNAIDFLHVEWHYKPVGLVSYGGVAGGTRTQQAIKPVLLALKMVPLHESVMVPMVSEFIDDDGAFVPNEVVDTGATVLLDELLRWSNALSTLRS
jgi:NAD(P)H-dependent FMN reductase